MIFLNSLTSIETKYFSLLIWHIDGNLFCWKSVEFINEPTHNIYVLSYGWSREVVSSLTLEWHKWRQRNAEKEQMDEKKKEHISIIQQVTVSYEIWQSRKLPSEYLRSYACFHEELIIKQEEHDIICHAILTAQLSD